MLSAFAITFVAIGLSVLFVAAYGHGIANAAVNGLLRVVTCTPDALRKAALMK